MTRADIRDVSPVVARAEAAPELFPGNSGATPNPLEPRNPSTRTVGDATLISSIARA
ncbi:hypothetical protein AB0I35_31420 [Nocardia sp. NPDC050378]|uniref:hypothetical protein n=1 Tax=Nocardia sp. NPDC050378 TaxID=3155400 RepID=UPI0033CCF7D1